MFGELSLKSAGDKLKKTRSIDLPHRTGRGIVP